MSANQTRVLKSALRSKGTWEMTAEELARVVADHKGWEGRAGGWIYTAAGRPIVQGWTGMAQKMERWGWIKVGSGVNWRRVGHGVDYRASVKK